MKDINVRQQEDLEERRWRDLSEFIQVSYTGNAELHFCHAIERHALTRHGAFLDVPPSDHECPDTPVFA